MFFIKNEEHKASVFSAQKIVVLKEEYYLENQMKEVRDKVEAEGKIEYNENTPFNEELDSFSDDILIGGTNVIPSKALYETDYDAYIAALSDYNSRPSD